jgi:hypothetical protein
MNPSVLVVIVVVASVAAFLPRGAWVLRVISALALLFVGPWYDCHHDADGIYRCSNSFDHALPNLPYRALAAGCCCVPCCWPLRRRNGSTVSRLALTIALTRSDDRGSTAMNRGLVDDAKDQVRAHVDQLPCTAITCLHTLLIRRFRVRSLPTRPTLTPTCVFAFAAPAGLETAPTDH